MDALEPNFNWFSFISNIYCNSSNWNETFEKMLEEEFNGSFANSTRPKDDTNVIWEIPFVRVLFILLYSIVFLTSVFGNLAVIIVVTIHWRMRSITNFCLANLAFADFCVGIFCVYQNLYFVFGKNWVLGGFLCKMYYFVHEMAHSASILILVAISVERYLAIIHPLNAKDWMTLNRLRLTIISVWVVSGIYSSPKLYYTQAMNHDYPFKGTKETICTPNFHKYNAKIFDQINMGILFVLPLLIITILYFNIGLALWRSTNSDFISNLQRRNENGNNEILRKTGYKSHLSCFNILCCFNKIQKICCSHSQYHQQRNHSRIQDHENEMEMNEISITVPGKLEQLSIVDTNTGSSLPSTSLSTNTTSIIIRENNNSDEDENEIKPVTEEILNTIATSSSSTKRTEKERNPSTASVSPSFPKLKIKLIRNRKKCNHQILRTRRKVIRMLIIMVLSFGICNLPYHARKLWQFFGMNYNGASSFSKIFTAVTFILMYGGSCINPFIYALCSQTFRQCLFDVLKCRPRRRTRVCSSPPDPPTVRIIQ